MLFTIIWDVIAGLVIGSLARAVLPGKQHVPIWMTILAGILGAVVGDLLSTAFGVRHTSGIDWVRHVLQIAVAAVFVLIGQRVVAIRAKH